MRKSPTSLRSIRAGKKMGNFKTAKYRNQKVRHGDRNFDSKAERARYIDLTLLEAAGHISDLECQPKFWLKCGGDDIKIRSKGYPNGRRASYRADFRYFDRRLSKTIVEDVKGMDTSESRLRRAIVEAEYGVLVEIVR